MSFASVFPQLMGYSEKAAESSGAGRMLTHPSPAPNPTGRSSERHAGRALVSISPPPPMGDKPPRRSPAEAPALSYEQALLLEGRFWPKVNWSTPDECWPWMGARLPAGYGWMRGFGQTNLYAHRVAYALASHGLGERLTVDHLCRNRPCCNPAHLEAVPLAENIRRRDRWRDECKRGHLFDGVRQRNGVEHRTCSTCLRDASRRYEARLRGGR